jgi:hypothetical protein
MNLPNDPSFARHDQQLRAINRRRFLKGVGACLALPTLASLGASRLLAAAAGGPPLATSTTGAPLRTAFIYFPNGAIPRHWAPMGGLRDFQLNQTMLPLAPLRDQIQILAGLDHRNATSGKDGGGDHARGNSVFLTGVRLNKSATDIRAGVSIDQEIAQRVSHLTRFSSLELTCDRDRKAGACDSGYSCAYQHNISWRSPTTPMTPEGNPRKLFERLFGTGDHGQRVANYQRRLATRRSILDFVIDDTRSLNRELDPADRQKLDQYLTGVRDVELRIQSAESFGPNADPVLATPDGIPESHGEHLALMFDLMLLAFQTDSTRVATMIMAHDGDNRPHSDIGVAEGHHDLSHHLNDEEKIAKVARIDRWYVEQYAAFLTRLQNTPDVDGNSLLHNSMIVYGSGNADGNRHTHDNLPIILAGGGGGRLMPGRNVNYGSAPAANLFLSLADKMGVDDLPRFGDSTGRLSLT